jgi:ATP-binding cassette subfamily B protein
VPTRFRSSDISRFFASLPLASRRLATAWWALLVLGGALPAVFVVVMGVVVRAVEEGRDLAVPLTVMATTFLLMQITPPLLAQVGMNLGDALSGTLNDRLLAATTSPPGMAHLERPELIDDLTLARDFDLGISGPPLSVSMGFIAQGLVAVVSGVGQALVLFGFRWWAPPLLLAAWG